MNHQEDHVIDRRGASDRTERLPGTDSGPAHPPMQAQYPMGPWPCCVELLPRWNTPLRHAVHPTQSPARPMLRAAVRMLHETRRVWREPLA